MQREPVTVEALDRIFVIRRPGDKSNPAVPLADQMPGRVTRTLQIVDRQAREHRAVLHGASEYEQRRMPRVFDQRGFVELGMQKNDAVDTTRNELLHARHFILYVPATADEERRKARLIQSVFDTAQPLRVKRAGHGLREHANGIGLAACEAARQHVRPIVEARDSLFHRFLLGGQHACGAVQNARHSAGGNAGCPRDFLECHIGWSLTVVVHGLQNTGF